MQPDQITTIADSFVAARKSGRSLSAFPGPVPEELAPAYAIQDEAIARFGGAVGGWKVGRIWPPLSEKFGADRLSGPIFAALITNGSAPIGRAFDGGFTAAEAEFLLRIGATPDPAKSKYTLDEAEALIDAVHVGIEVASSPLATINALGPPVIISDFGNNNGLIMGPAVSDWRESGFADWEVVTKIDGAEAGRGCASAFPDGPIGSVRFLLENLVARGIRVPAGTWVSTGAVTGVHTVGAGQRVTARFGPDHHLECTIEAVPQK